MKDKSTQDKQQPKKPYRKPELKQVPLKPEEAVLGFCKVSSGDGPGAANCGFPVGCYTAGS